MARSALPLLAALRAPLLVVAVASKSDMPTRTTGSRCDTCKSVQDETILVQLSAESFTRKRMREGGVSPIAEELDAITALTGNEDMAQHHLQWEPTEPVLDVAKVKTKLAIVPHMLEGDPAGADSRMDEAKKEFADAVAAVESAKTKLESARIEEVEAAGINHHLGNFAAELDAALKNITNGAHAHWNTQQRLTQEMTQAILASVNDSFASNKLGDVIEEVTTNLSHPSLLEIRGEDKGEDQHPQETVDKDSEKKILDELKPMIHAQLTKELLPDMKKDIMHDVTDALNLIVWPKYLVPFETAKWVGVKDLLTKVDQSVNSNHLSWKKRAGDASSKVRSLKVALRLKQQVRAKADRAVSAAVNALTKDHVEEAAAATSKTTPPPTLETTTPESTTMATTSTTPPPEPSATTTIAPTAGKAKLSEGFQEVAAGTSTEIVKSLARPNLSMLSPAWCAIAFCAVLLLGL